MCLRFYTKTPKYDSAIQTAKKDITVYKVVELTTDYTYRSLYAYFKYELGVHYKAGVDWPEGCVYTDLIVSNDGEYPQYIYNGYHSYDSLEVANKRNNDGWCDNLQTYVMECHIPKGAKYIVGTNNDIISSEIIIDKQL